MPLLIAVFNVCRTLLAARAALAAENLALRQQINVLQRSVARPQLRRRDRLFWVRLSCWFSGWRSWLAIVKPETVIGWHRQGFRLYWRWKSRGGKTGRLTVSAEVRRRLPPHGPRQPDLGRAAHHLGTAPPRL